MSIHSRLIRRTLAPACFVVFAAMGGTALAQPDPKAIKAFASAMDVSALIAKAKAERKPDQGNFVQTVVQLPPYTVNLEYRVPDVRQGASVHEREAEIFFVVEGSGTAITGGKLKDERRSNAENLSGTGIDGGTSRQVSKGDVLFVPEKTPHQFVPAGGPLVLMSLHVPRTSN
jgi:mannose-6-phosphate isomerase-like protein (cupin superfamily)